LIINNLVITDHYLYSCFTHKDITIQDIIDNHHCSVWIIKVIDNNEIEVKISLQLNLQW
jgi:hypothetical protein